MSNNIENAPVKLEHITALGYKEWDFEPSVYGYVWWFKYPTNKDWLLMYSNNGCVLKNEVTSERYDFDTKNELINKHLKLVHK